MLSVIVVSALACWAQEAKPPAGVDEALRARVNEFFRYHVTAQFRKAEPLVAEDSQDFFYNQNKPHYLGYNGIDSVRYSENFTHAYVVVTVKTAAVAEAANFGVMPAIPIPSMWKLENGKWCWYVDPDILRHTPFGDLPPETVARALAAMRGSDSGADAAAPASPAPVTPQMAAAIQASVPQFGAGMMRDPNTPTGQVKPDRQKVELKPGETATVKVTDGGTYSFSLLLVGQIEGIEATLDRKELSESNPVTLTLKAASGAKSGAVNVVVVETGEMIPIAVTVK